MKILIIGVLPQEVGGSYTSGVANVVYELTQNQKEFDSINLFATNISNRKCRRSNNLKNDELLSYYGYRFPVFEFFRALLKPKRLIDELKAYKNEIGKSPARFLFYRLNLLKLINSVDPDIIHLHGNTLVYPLVFANPDDIPVVVTFHGVFYKGNPKTEKFRKIYLQTASSRFLKMIFYQLW